jgi:UDP-N-acetylmuramoyl-L-alanyl-D-glutamate--2,6-diaminopimelate ligase
VPVAIRPTRSLSRPLSGLGALLGVKLPTDREVRPVPPGTMMPNEPGPEGAVCGVTHDSRMVRPGDLYAALPGTRVHGAEFSAAAVAAGAVAIFTDPAGRDRAAAAGVPVYVVADPRARLGEVACWVYGDPSRKLRLIGVTGTSGKTTTSYLAEAGLRMAGHVTGLIGGVETRIGTDVQPSELTTPEATDLQALLATMAERDVTAAAMEVSSHALALGRVAGTHYDVAVFTNLSQDHLDFHADLEDYFAAKAELFTPRYARAGVVNLDDAYGQRLAARAPIPITTFSPAGNPAADWRAASVRVGADGSAFRVIGPGGVEADASLALVGQFNVANALGAIVALVEAGIGLDDAVAGVGSCPGVPGRLERVGAGGAAPDPPACLSAYVPDLTVLVDYSHKPGAVEAVLGALRPVTQGNLIIVLGCGGDRDRAKRPLMGAAAAALADVAIFTSDNPRSEDPLAILAAMLDGATGVPPSRRAHVIVEPDRAAAIGLAVSSAAKGDVILVAGKGHERGQYVAGRVLPFDDREVTAEALRHRAAAYRAAHQRGEL